MDKTNSNNKIKSDKVMKINTKKDSYDVFLEKFEILVKENEKNHPDSEIIYFLKFILDREIKFFNFQVAEEKLVKNLMLLWNEYNNHASGTPQKLENLNSNNTDEISNKINNNEKIPNYFLSEEFSIKEINLIIMNNIDKFNIKLDFKKLTNIYDVYLNNPESLPSTKKFLFENNFKVQNTNEYSYIIQLIFKSSQKEIKCIYEKDFPPFNHHPELRNKIDDAIIKTIIKSKESESKKNSSQNLKNFELLLRKFLKAKKSSERTQGNQNNSLSVTMNNLSTSNLSDSKNNSLLQSLESSTVLNEMKFFDEFKKILFQNNSDLTEDNFDLFENMVIKTISEKFTFAEYGNYVYLYLYDNLKKLRDPKTLETLKNKFKENKDLNYENFEKIKQEMIYYYEIRQGVLDLFLKNSSSYIDSSKNIAKTMLSQNISKENVNITSSISGGSTISSTVNTINSTNSTQSQLDVQLEKFATNFLMLIFITSKIKNLTEFDLAQNQVLNDNSLACVSALKINDSITKVSFTMNKLGDEGCWGLGRVFNYNQKIVDLDLSLNMMTDENLNSFLIGLGNSTTSLVKLNLSNNFSITKKSGKYIAQIIEKSPYLKYLNINKNPIETGFDFISSTLMKLFNENKTQLEDLLALQIKLDSNSLKIFSEVMKHPRCTIKSLVLSENKFNNEGGSKLLRAIGKNRSLEELILYKCEINNDFGKDLIFMLTNNRSLISVNLFENKINDPDLFLRLISFCQGQSTKAMEYLENPYSEENVEIFNLFKNNQNEQDKNIEVQKMQHKFLKREILLSLIPDPNEKINSQNVSQGSTHFSNNNLKIFDLSSNKCRFKIDETFKNIMTNVDVEMLDICKNFEDDESSDQVMGNEFNELIFNKQNKNKIIY
jgi:hypothetical protein